MLSADLCNLFGLTKVRSSAFPGSSASTPEEQPGAVSSLEGEGAALSSPPKCPPSLQAGVSSAEVQLRCCKYRVRQYSGRAPIISKAVLRHKARAPCSAIPCGRGMVAPDGVCGADGLCHRLCRGVSGPCKAAHPCRGRQRVGVVMGWKSQLDNFITINIICSYAGRGYDTNN